MMHRFKSNPREPGFLSDTEPILRSGLNYDPAVAFGVVESEILPLI